ncbi:MAG: TRAP transporter substrate-binding protein [candidate division KSB1 bacterium]|nr:TRAP transporter substrate-binding protein [candidate division KSB1 bacterium]
MRRISLFLAAVALIISGCGNNSGVTNLKLAHGLATSHPVHQGMEYMAEKALELSDSTLVIQIYPSEQLGNEKETLEKLQMGAIAMCKVSSSMLERFVEEYKVFALPYLFNNEEHVWKVLNGDLGKEILTAGESKKLKGLVYYDAGARSFYTREKPILHPDDLKGLKIRTQQSPMAMDMIRSMGGSATPISWGELYTSLQAGVVDGAENNVPSLYTSNHYEVCKHYSLDQHTVVPDVVVINTTAYERLSEEHKQVLQQAAEASVSYQREMWDEFVENAMQKMKKKACKCISRTKPRFRNAPGPCMINLTEPVSGNWLRLYKRWNNAKTLFEQIVSCP